MTTQPIDWQHLYALEEGLAHEQARLANAKINFATSKTKSEKKKAKLQYEIKQRTVWVSQCVKEINSFKDFCGLNDMPEMSDDELLACFN